ncbi:MAG TPA: two-component regulator propeller domain-containing protein, partial [Puia sp.]
MTQTRNLIQHPARHLALLFMLLTACLCAFPQRQPVKFEHISTNLGLSQSSVLCIFQDSRGFMWFGTRDGLDRYNGYEFTVYKNVPNDPKTISNNFITGITEDGNGDLWIATWGGGVNRYDHTKDRFIHYSTNSFTRFINCVLQDRRGQIWIGTNGGGVDVLNPTTGVVHTYAHDPDNPTSLS